jgi:hypothetical protein
VRFTLVEICQALVKDESPMKAWVFPPANDATPFSITKAEGLCEDILILTDKSLFFFRFQYSIESVICQEQISLGSVKKIEKGKNDH